ncbi:phosphonate C-P lyase system protein PhnH [Pseudomonas sp. Choline-3u-10]|jgi:alpha-D-ribose 1-methylphosphonate 5-triphosphate synthase subunit PhnH|uniref:phosphonate C-P lyase system protein PhnH n=1 Tax=Pseudomonadaceae TaxID=135621 RepID=UPI000617CF6F|nr:MULTISPECIES: phosphonate C-P lyase system protein PhnH [Pseudomonadaceae]MAL35714.1 phosphonate C-P lyase system protein PhnH [Pseudomonas sp.]MBU0947834.1 phosphonate C-P lyase system protein PhnH [Gammaproteobacteria bacterium]KJJ61679.1 carbon-phosphorus lyase [Pseudomonas sp. 10B238]MBK3796126.1 phosphonate C-P lyase system protein PhnH [Stutzerimonas stutzeri]MBK3876628.1 phosphonate C-P lyase system protein PhnH [Stutzerimonas stutzeri]|tara:strand:+ start:1660 stop:2259 length:600 start_codon:yes stop_codon:yes gene_type:complete
MSADLLHPAFNDQVLDSQRVFRAALKALAEPGLTQQLIPIQALEPLAPASYALCLSLLDGDTRLWLAPAFDTPTVRANLAFHCGCPIVDERESADFALLGVQELVDLSGFFTGSERFPDQSCTLLVQLDALGDGAALSWSGPGILGQREVSLPVPAAFWQQRAARNDFPRGLDLFFAADQSLIGLPRSTRIAVSIEEVA